MTKLEQSWASPPLSVAIEGPDGSEVVSVGKPFARVGSHVSCELALPEAGRCVAYLHSTPRGVWFCRLDRETETAGASSVEAKGWLREDRCLEIPPYRLRIETPESPATQHADSRPPLSRWLAVSYAGEELTRTRIQAHEPLVVGRSRRCGLRILHQRVSRMHCSLYWDGESLWGVDLFSGNGCYVLGQRVDASEIPQGRSIRLGSVKVRLVDGPPTEDSEEALPLEEPAQANSRSLSATLASRDRTELFPSTSLQVEPESGSSHGDADEAPRLDPTAEAAPSEPDEPHDSTQDVLNSGHEVIHLRRQLETREAELRAVQSELAAAQELIEAERDRLLEQEAVAERREYDWMAQLKGLQDQLTAASEAHQIATKQSNERIQQLVNQLAVVEAELVEQTTMVESRIELDRKAAEIARVELEQRVARLDQQKRAADDELAAERASAKLARQKLDERQAALKRQIDEARSRVAEEQAKVERLRQDLECQSTESERLRKRAESNQLENTELERRMAAQANEINAYHSRLDATKGRQETWASERRQLREVLQLERESHEETRQQLAETQLRLNELQAFAASTASQAATVGPASHAGIGVTKTKRDVEPIEPLAEPVHSAMGDISEHRGGDPVARDLPSPQIPAVDAADDADADPNYERHLGRFGRLGQQQRSRERVLIASLVVLAVLVVGGIGGWLCYRLVFSPGSLFPELTWPTASVVRPPDDVRVGSVHTCRESAACHIRAG